jgi:drug/metabolite transporter (DMT)-like permease
VAAEFTSIGLFMAAVTSVSNVLKDVAGKKVLDSHELIATTFWFRLVVLIALFTVFGVIFWLGGIPQLQDGGPIFGIKALHFAPLPTFIFYVVLDGILVGTASMLYYRAIQISPLSMCVPYLAFTPIFLIPTGYFLLGELPPAIKLLGVALIVVGSLVMHRQLFAISLFEPVRAVWREKGSRYVLIVAILFAFGNPLDKKLVTMGGAFTHAFAYALAVFIFYCFFAFFQKAEISKPIKSAPKWILVCGLLDALALVLQLSTHNYIDVVITISIKRAGIILAVFLGWLVFRERNITDKLIASTVIVAGVLIIYLPLDEIQTAILTGSVLIIMIIALYLTRHQNISENTELENEAQILTD